MLFCNNITNLWLAINICVVELRWASTLGWTDFRPRDHCDSQDYVIGSLHYKLLYLCQ